MDNTAQGQLFVNVAGVTADAPLTVELLDALDRPIPGYSGADTAKIKTPGTQQPITWPAHPDGRGPRDHEFSVRVSLPDSDDVRLYATYIRP